MSEPIEYQTPLPIGRNLRFHELPDGLRVTREVVSRFALWREAVIPVVCVLGLVISTAVMLLVIGLIRDVTREALLLVRIGASLVMLIPIIWIIRQSLLNGGVVSEIAVTRDSVYWRKQNLWGDREYFWPLETIKSVSFDANNRSVKIARTRGPSLNAFAYFRSDELADAALRLNMAIDQSRRLAKSQSAQSN
jgi:hypothetical protein